MRKETILAVFLGIIFGGIVALFLIVKNKEFQLNKTKVIAPTGLVTQKSVKDKDKVNIVPLEITEPNDSIIITTNSVKIKGKVTKGSLIVIESPVNEMIFKNEKEVFSVDFPLALGENVINLVAYPNDKHVRIQEKNFKVYYLEE